MPMLHRLLLWGACVSVALSSAAQPLTLPLQFDFGSGQAAAGYRQVLPTTTYSPERGYGLASEQPVKSRTRKGNNPLTDDFLTSTQPFYFVVDLPEGNYEVTLTLGDPKGTSTTTVKAESRRLMLHHLQTARGEQVTRTFTVNVRTPRINAEERIRLKPREHDYLNWDDKLTLEFNDARPCVAALEIRRATAPTTIFLAGNSTVVDQETEPWAAWGQMLPSFLKPDAVVANLAESGETLAAFQSEGRLAKVLSMIQPGDFLFIEFAHNDQKNRDPAAGAYRGYSDRLREFIREARAKRAHPVLVTSMHRRRFDEDGHIINTLEDYPDAMRNVAQELDVPLIDLNAMSKTLYEAMGPEDTKKAFVHYPAGTFPGQDQELKDDTHFNPYGAYEMARCIVQAIQEQGLAVGQLLRDAIPPFDPAHPDPLAMWHWPDSPNASLVKPDGN